MVLPSFLYVSNSLGFVHAPPQIITFSRVSLCFILILNYLVLSFLYFPVILFLSWFHDNSSISPCFPACVSLIIILITPQIFTFYLVSPVFLLFTRLLYCSPSFTSLLYVLSLFTSAHCYQYPISRFPIHTSFRVGILDAHSGSQEFQPRSLLSSFTARLIEYSGGFLKVVVFSLATHGSCLSHQTVPHGSQATTTRFLLFVTPHTPHVSLCLLSPPVLSISPFSFSRVKFPPDPPLYDTSYPHPLQRITTTHPTVHAPPLPAFHISHSTNAINRHLRI